MARCHHGPVPPLGACLARGAQGTPGWAPGAAGWCWKCCSARLGCCRAGLPAHPWHLPILGWPKRPVLCPAVCPWGLCLWGAAAGAGVAPVGPDGRGTRGHCPVPLASPRSALLAMLLGCRGHCCTLQALQVSNLLIYNSKACPYINEPLMSC